MPFKFRKKKKIAEVHQFDGPTSSGAASMNVYVFEDESCETVEFNWLGAEVLRYEGEPRPVPEGTTMPPARPRPAGAAPLAKPIGAPAPSPAAPLEPMPQQPPPQPARRSAS